MANNDPDFDLRTATGKEIEAVMNLGVVKALRAHKAAGVSITVWDRVTGEIVTVPPEEIPDYPDSDEVTTVKPPARLAPTN